LPAFLVNTFTKLTLTAMVSKVGARSFIKITVVPN
jgi:hypothetical protein